MAILIDTTELVVHKSAHSLSCLERWAEILIPARNDFMITGYTPRDYSCFSENELDELYASIKNRPAPGNTWHAKAQALINELQKIPDDDEPRSRTRQRVLGSSTMLPDAVIDTDETAVDDITPQEDETMTTKATKKTAAKKKTASKKTASKKTASKKTASKKSASKKAAAKPAVERVNQNGVTRPAAGTKTGTVWDIADKLSAKAGEPAVRASVIEEAAKSNIPKATVSTQYQRWRKFHGLA